MKSHIARVQKYEYIYEESANKPTLFISFFKTILSKIQSGPNLAQSSHFSLIESINEKDVIRFICTYRLSGIVYGSDQLETTLSVSTNI